MPYLQPNQGTTMHKLIKTTDPKIHQYRGWQIEKQVDDSFAITFSKDLWSTEFIVQSPPIATVREAQKAIDQQVEQGK